jgi:hypothetical protein
MQRGEKHNQGHKYGSEPDLDMAETWNNQNTSAHGSSGMRGREVDILSPHGGDQKPHPHRMKSASDNSCIELDRTREGISELEDCQ